MISLVAAHTLINALAKRRLVPAYDGGVGASRGEVDAGVLNTLVLAVEQVGGAGGMYAGVAALCRVYPVVCRQAQVV